ncbi:MAG: exo-alpha-sialidase [Acidobacteria bacterium]|nr:exo-alpha-sialidase [Acidobacteriota bacterium]
MLLVLSVAPVAQGPNRQPQLAAGNGMTAMVFGSGEGIWFARSVDGGRSFTAPAKIADLPKMLLGRHRGPRVAIAGGAIVVSAIGSEAGDLVAWRSTDGGRTWSAPVRVNDVPRAAREGLHAMAGDGAGHMAAIWLDDRVGPRGKRLWGAFSDDGGATWRKNAMLYESPSGSICECCHPSLAAAGAGEFVAMWRNSLDGSRDLYTMRLRGGRPEGPAVKQGEGTWKLDACPMDGGGVAVRDGRVASAWRREKDVYLAETGKPEVKLGAGQDIALGANQRGVYAVWSTAQGIAARVPGAPDVTKLSDSGGFPAIAAAPDGGMVVAWEENGAIRVARL